MHRMVYTLFHLQCAEIISLKHLLFGWTFKASMCYWNRWV